MIGRGSIGNPKIFDHINEFLLNGNIISFKNSKETMKKHVEVYEQRIDEFLEGIRLNFPSEEYKFTELKRNAIWLTKDIPNSTEIRYELSKIKSLDKLKAKLEKYYKI